MVATSKTSQVKTKGTKKRNPDPAQGLLAELRKERSNAKAIETSRHSLFGGTLVINRPDGKRKYISAANPANQTAPTTVKRRKNRRREPFVGSRHGSHVVDANRENPTALRAQHTLDTFCRRFVKDCYGPLMKSIKNEFRRESVRLEDGDKVIFFRVVWFFSQWCRVADKHTTSGHLIFTMDVFTFNLVLNAIDTYSQHKKYRQLEQAVAMYSEMIHFLRKLYLSKDPTEAIMALGLMDRLFYGAEPMDRLPKLLSRWMPGTATREYLCDLTETVHITVKLLEEVASKLGQNNTLNEEKKRDSIEKMKASARSFDVSSYFVRKLVSNQTVYLYTQLLSQYAVNSPRVNHRIMAFMLRLAKVEIVSPDADDGPVNKLAVNRVTLKPVLFQIQLLLVLHKILNDATIRADPTYSPLLAFATNVMQSFATSAKGNNVMFVECLFRHPHPHRYSDLVTNNYVNEELRMIAEREMLLAEQEGMEDMVDQEEQIDLEGSTEDRPKDLEPTSDGDEEEEYEWDGTK